MVAATAKALESAGDRRDATAETDAWETTNLHTVSTRMIQTMFQENHVGEATALAVLLFLMVFFGTAVSLRVLRREAVEM